MKKCIIYGAGKHGEQAFKELKDTLEILFFVDSDEKRWGESFFCFEIKPPKVISENKDMLVVVAVKYVEKSLLENIKALGARNVKIYYPGLGIDDVRADEMKRDRPGILVESAPLYAKYKNPNGSERLMFNIMRELDVLETNILPVMVIDGDVVTSSSCAEQCEIYRDSFKNIKLTKINIVKGDKVLFLSSTVYGSFYNIIEGIESNIASYVLIWDIYCTYKKHIMYGYFKKGQVEKLKRALANAKAIICYSRTVADEVIKYYIKIEVNRESPLNFYVFPLGYDLRPQLDNSVRETINDYMSSGKVFLMVGTIKPHKGYEYVLEVFKNSSLTDDVKLLVIGQKSNNRNDWYLSDKLDAAMSEMRNFLWIDNASDDELSYCYEHATALIQASFYEGYGLPIIEGAQYGLPLICSDIPIFREVSCGKADFFKAGDADDLLKTLNRWISENEHPDSREIPLHTWKESAEALIRIVEGEMDPYKVIK